MSCDCGYKSASESGSEMVDPAKNNFEAQASAVVAAATHPVRVIVELGGNDIKGGDCFHPSIGGQNTLSEVIWNNNPFK